MAVERSALCLYCERRVGDTVDHVPPKSLFPPPRPSNLVTVPCCTSCHRSFMKDDEYFRLMLVLRDDVRDSASAQTGLRAVMRALRRPQARRLAQQLFSGMRYLQVR